ncbi:Cna B-type domain-containing protein, partial [Selenomonadales bacterium OttesenSCG-928-I06]|nr:Cna B-type domain-containing protein [Selenomonadales bacterium OttesenSCG-928-I06]
TFGDYTVQEIAAPIGYTGDTTVYDVVVNVNGTTTIDDEVASNFEVVNDKSPIYGFTFKKVDAAGVGLAGATFTLSNGSTATSGLDGKVTFSGLTFGNYTVQETTAPIGYTGDSTVYSVVVNSNGTTEINEVDSANFEVTNTKSATYGFTFKKVDEDGVGLAGATFTLSNGDTETSAADGSVTFSNLTFGHYTVQETIAPTGYTLDDEIYDVVINSNGTTTIDTIPVSNFEVTNTKSPTYSFTFKKVDGAGIGLAGAVFKLSNGQTATSAANGNVTFTGLKFGNYTVQEITAPTGYTGDNTVYNVVISQDGTTTINTTPASSFTVTNTKSATYSFAFKKVDGDGADLAGAVFMLSNGKTATSAADGSVTFSDLEFGTYTIQETNAPVGYTRDDTIFTVVVNVDGTTTIDTITASNFTVTNQKSETYGFTFKKVDGAGVGLEGAIFRLSNGQIATSAADGSVTFSGFAFGNYTLEEISAPEGYTGDPQSYDVVVSPDGTTTIDTTPASSFTVTNTKSATYSFKFKKVDAGGVGLAGAIFTLSDGQTATSGADGSVIFSGLTFGNYTVQETSAPIGYKENSTVYNVVVNPNGTTEINGEDSANFEVTNTKSTTYSFTFKKVDGSDIGLAGAVFRLSNGNTATSAVNGSVTFSDLAFGHYTVQEITAPTGYTGDSETYDVVISSNGTTTIEGTAASSFKITNTKSPTYSFTFKKVDGAGIGLAGAVFKLSNGLTAISAANGNVTFSGLTFGNYTVQETTAPAGYTKDSTEYAVVVNSNGTTTINDIVASSFEVTNTKSADYSFAFKKVDGNGVGLAGAIFTLSNGQTATSGADGSVTFGGLTFGNYTVQETTIPTGYTGDSTVYNVVVNPNGTTEINGIDSTNFEVENILIPTYGFTFTKIDKDTNAGLAGAVFTLSNGKTATSTAAGSVTFSGLLPGNYTMQETSAPGNYLKDSATYNVVVAPNGTITINGNSPSSLTVININLDLTVLVNGTVTWRDRGGSDTHWPNEAILTLYRNGASVATTSVAGAKHGTTLNFAFSPQPKYDSNGNAYTYTISESIPGNSSPGVSWEYRYRDGSIWGTGKTGLTSPAISVDASGNVNYYYTITNTKY